MILGFHEYWDKKKTQPTNFREKILAGAGYDRLIYVVPQNGELIEIGSYAGKSITGTAITGYTKKLHTLRLDEHNRWKADMSIQMVYRGPKYSIKDHFNKGIPELERCVSIQKVEIRYLTPEEIKSSRGTTYYDPIIKIDGKFFDRLDTLARNDGFSGYEMKGKYIDDPSYSFLKYFNKSVTMKLIHWTDLRY